MVTKSKLKMALAAEKGTDFKKLKLLKKQKEAEKRNAAARGADDKDSDEEKEEKTIQIEADFEDEDDEEEDEDDEDDEEPQVCNGLTIYLQLPLTNITSTTYKASTTATTQTLQSSLRRRLFASPRETHSRRPSSHNWQLRRQPLLLLKRTRRKILRQTTSPCQTLKISTTKIRRTLFPTNASPLTTQPPSSPP